MKIDVKDAPEGFIPVKAEFLCGGCKLYRNDKCLSMENVRCCPTERNDKQIVIFKRKEV